MRLELSVCASLLDCIGSCTLLLSAVSLVGAFDPVGALSFGGAGPLLSASESERLGGRFGLVRGFSFSSG